MKEHIDSNKQHRSLELALANIETFSEQLEKELVPNLSHLEVEEGKLIAHPHTSLKKTIALAYNIIAAQSDVESEVLNEILHSSEVIKSYLPFLQVLEEGGSTEQKKFVAYAKTAIERFNNTLEDSKALSNSWQQRIVCFLYQKSGMHIDNRLIKIEFPKKAFLQIDFARQTAFPSAKSLKINSSLQELDSSDAASQKIGLLREMMLPSFQVERQTLELYQMKVITLLEKHKLLTRKEARTLVVETPHQLNFDKETLRLTLSQQLTPLPGQIMSASATFRMDERNRTFSIFESDNLTLTSTQTGFPHPLQHNGWALSDKLIPKNLQRYSELPTFKELFTNQQLIADELLPNGLLTAKARDLFHMKRSTFNLHRDLFLDYHMRLALTLLQSAPSLRKDDKATAAQTIEIFFELLRQETLPFDVLAETYALIMERCVTLPLAAIEKAWIDGERSDYIELLHTETGIDNVFSPRNSFKIASENYIEAMHFHLSPAFHLLIRQQLSELMECAPPELTLFAKKLQVATYLQLQEFQHELTLDPASIDIPQRLYQLLDNDIALFKAETLDNLPWKAVMAANELEDYYIKRYKK